MSFANILDEKTFSSSPSRSLSRCTVTNISWKNVDSLDLPPSPWSLKKTKMISRKIRKFQQISGEKIPTHIYIPGDSAGALFWDVFFCNPFQRLLVTSN